MNKKTKIELENTAKVINEKYDLFKGVKGMEPFMEFLEECKVDIWIRQLDRSLDADHLKALCADISWKERKYKADAGLLSPEEAAARKRLFDFFNSPCDLPPEVDIKPQIKRHKMIGKRKT